ncbi:MAG TPA: hypothetical protein VG432_05540 [Gemmatimonadaceae bacterium]|nr:hypothetical protein [Gemmatimonadaceae bacterium]
MTFTPRVNAPRGAGPPIAVAAAVLSPLDATAEQLFATHMARHMVPIGTRSRSGGRFKDREEV